MEARGVTEWGADGRARNATAASVGKTNWTELVKTVWSKTEQLVGQMVDAKWQEEKESEKKKEGTTDDKTTDVIDMVGRVLSSVALILTFVIGKY